MAEERKPLTIRRPPDFVFRYRKPSRTVPAQEVIQSQGTFDFVGIKYPPIYHETDEFFEKYKLKREWFKYPVVFSDGQIFVHETYPPLTEEEEKMGGQLACFKDCPYPTKGHPFPEALYAVNQAKRFTRTLIEGFSKGDIPFIILFLILPQKNKFIERRLVTYNGVCRKVMETYILEERFMSKYGKEIYRFIKRFLVKLGINEGIANDFAECFASLIDWDNAYWMRIGDTFAETTKELMLKNPRKELKRLGEITTKRNPTDPLTAKRFSKILNMASNILFFPRYKRIFRECIQESDFENFQFDEADRYHSWLYADYDYGGEPLAIRLEKWYAFHKEHPPLPTRIQITP